MSLLSSTGLPLSLQPLHAFEQGRIVTYSFPGFFFEAQHSLLDVVSKHYVLGLDTQLYKLKALGGLLRRAH